MKSHFKLKPIYQASILSAALFIPNSVLANSEAFPEKGIYAMTSTDLIQKMVERNSQVLYANLQNQIARQKINFEEGVYESELFSTARYDDTLVQATADRKLNSSQALQTFEEDNTNLEVGVRKVIPSGAELKFSYTGLQQTNNVIPLTNNNENTEYTESLNLSIKQPLLKGMGNAQSEMRINKAKLEALIVQAQFKQELLKMSSEALNLYWNLYKVKAFLKVRQDALNNAQKSYNDVSVRVDAGKLPKTALYEVKSNILKRKADLHVAELSVNETQNKLKTLLNLSSVEYDELEFNVVDEPKTKGMKLSANFDEYFNWVLNGWPNYLIAAQKVNIQNEEIIAAQDERKPTLDLEVGYSTNTLNYNWSPSDTLSTDYPSWFVGLNFSMYLQGNERAKAKENLARIKKQQEALDLDAVKAGLANDLKHKLYQVETSYDELIALEENVEMLNIMFLAEKEEFDLGKSRLMDLYEREDRLSFAKQRYIQGMVKYELSKVALSLADGSLLTKYQVNIEDDLPANSEMPNLLTETSASN